MLLYNKCGFLTIAQSRALTELKRNKDLVIVKANKGNSTVVMNVLVYNAKLHAMLADKTTL